MLHEKLAELQESLIKYERTQDEFLVDREGLWQLYEEGIVDSNGEYKLGD